MQGQAQDLGGNWLAANDLNFSERYLAAVKRVTPADLQRVARQYLTPENRTLYALLPSRRRAEAGLESETSLATIRSRNSSFPTACGCWSRKTIACRLSNSARSSKAACSPKPPDNNGITQLTGKLLLERDRPRTAEDIAREIESVGGSIDSYGGNNSFGVNAEVMSGDFAIGLGFVATCC